MVACGLGQEGLREEVKCVVPRMVGPTKDLRRKFRYISVAQDRARSQDRKIAIAQISISQEAGSNFSCLWFCHSEPEMPNI